MSKLLTKPCALLMLLSLSVAVSGCVTSGRKDDCVWAAPIYVPMEDVDIISDELVDSILKHNEQYAKVCMGRDT